MASIPTIRQIESSVQRLPLIDSDTAEVVALLDDPDSNYDQITEKLSPGLAARMLDLVNSGPSGREVRSIGLAVKLLGYRRMKKILKAAIAVDHFDRRLPGFDFDRFIAQARFCAGVARILGGIFDFSAPGDLTTVATLQNIGKLVIAVYFEEHHRAIVALKRRDHLPTSLAERRVLGMTHGEIGAIALRRYHVPAEICRAVKFHDHHVPVEPGRELTELQVISREAATVVGRFQLPTAFDPVELPGRMQRTVAAGKRLLPQMALPHIRAGGYDRAFPDLVERIGIMLANDLQRLLAPRQPGD